jgi:hypothetical protein
MTIINNDNELSQAIGKDMEKALKVVSNYLVNQTRMSVEEKVYYAWPATKWYDRLEGKGGFLGSWDSEISPFDGTSVKSKIFSNPEKMVYNGSKFQHGNDFTDRRKDLAEYIAEGTHYDWLGDSPNDTSFARDYWTPVLEQLDDGSVERVLENSMKSLKINFTKG